MKQKRKEEREQKKLEKEQKKERKRKEHEKKGGNSQRKGKGRNVVIAQVKMHLLLTEVRTRVTTRVIHAQSGLLIGIYQNKSDAGSEARNTVCYAREPPPFQQVWCFGLTATVAESGHTHIVLWVTTQLHVSLFVHYVVLELYGVCCLCAAKAIL